MSFRSITDTTADQCACCGEGTAALSCRTRGGTASLGGISEYASPSTPPKKYLTETLTTPGGVICNLNWDGSFGGCAGSPSSILSQAQQYGGTLTYSAVDLTSVNTQTLAFCNQVLPTPACPPCSPSGDIGGFQSGPFVLRGGVGFCGQILVSISQTTVVYGFDGSCCFLIGPPADYRMYQGNAQGDLSNEDTEDNAIARLLATIPGGTWSAYVQTGDGSGGTCLPQSCCKAQYQQRTTGFSFAYQEAQYKAVLTALDPLTNYVVNFEVYRRLQGSSDPWSLLLVAPYGFTSDASGNYSGIIDQDVPNLEGYETYVCCPLIYKP